ncbi:hypothetical protein EAO75_31805, partial [Streptomyces sp. uw30]
MHGLEPTQSTLTARVLTVATLTWLLVSAPAGAAGATVCAYADTGPDGAQSVAVVGSLTWPTPPQCPTPT